LLFSKACLPVGLIDAAFVIACSIAVKSEYAIGHATRVPRCIHRKHSHRLAQP
jgi:hypothetical protein